MPSPTLHPQQCQKILAYVRAGADPEMAALAVGVSLMEFRKAIEYAQQNPNPARRGEDGMPIGCSTIRRGVVNLQFFAWEVLQTWAQARLAADVRMFKEKPADWLRLGPGRACRIGKQCPKVSKAPESVPYPQGPNSPKGKGEKTRVVTTQAGNPSRAKTKNQEIRG